MNPNDQTTVYAGDLEVNAKGDKRYSKRIDRGDQTRVRRLNKKSVDQSGQPRTATAASLILGHAGFNQVDR
jgi:hypothetical protein